MVAIPILNNQQMAIASAITGISASDINKSYLEQKKENDIKWAIDFFEQDRAWYDNTMQKIKEMEKELPDNMYHREKTIKLYSWLIDEVPQNRDLSIPLEMDRRYSKSECIKLVLTNPDMYFKILSWD